MKNREDKLFNTPHPTHIKYSDGSEKWFDYSEDGSVHIRNSAGYEVWKNADGMETVRIHVNKDERLYEYDENGKIRYSKTVSKKYGTKEVWYENHLAIRVVTDEMCCQYRYNDNLTCCYKKTVSKLDNSVYEEYLDKNGKVIKAKTTQNKNISTLKFKYDEHGYLYRIYHLIQTPSYSRLAMYNKDSVEITDSFGRCCYKIENDLISIKKGFLDMSNDKHPFGDNQFVKGSYRVNKSSGFIDSDDYNWLEIENCDDDIIHLIGTKNGYRNKERFWFYNLNMLSQDDSSLIDNLGVLMPQTLTKKFKFNKTKCNFTTPEGKEVSINELLHSIIHIGYFDMDGDYIVIDDNTSIIFNCMKDAAVVEIVCD